MATRSAITSSSFDWYRIGALGSTFTAHAAALLLILMPVVAPPIQRSLQRSIEVSFVEAPEPPPPVPPEVEPLPKPKAVVPRPVAAPPRPAPTPVPASAVDVPDSAAVPMPAVDASDIRPVATEPTPAAGNGETRQLSYDGALRAKYPPASIRAREQGKVLLRVLVDAQGRVERIEIARSSGYPKLDAAAREAVRRARFKPVLLSGKASAAWGLVPMEFRLDQA